MTNSWINCFAESLKELEQESDVKGSAAWTAFLTKVMHRTGEKMDCYVQSKNTKKNADSGEYLNIDALFFKNSDCSGWDSDFAPPVLPFAAVELENDYSEKKIAYCLWKLLCIRCEIRALICHQANAQKLSLLKRYLEKIITDNNLASEARKKLYVVIGDDSSDDSTWQDYYAAFKWQHSRLEPIQIFGEALSEGSTDR